MIIRNTQYATFREQARLTFIQKILPSIREDFPEKTWKLSDKELTQALAERVQRAAQYRLTIEEDVYRFIKLDFRFGSKFELAEENKSVLKLLQHRTLDGSLKMEKVYNLIFKL